MKRRASIGGWMMAVLAFGVILGLGREGALGNPVVFYGLIASPLVLLVVHVLYFMVFPLKLLKTLARGDQARRRRILEWVAATPSVVGGWVKFLPHFMLFQMNVMDRDYEAALRRGELALKFRPLPGNESELRRKMADCLDQLGRSAEAEAQRQAAEACLKGIKTDFLERKAHAKLLSEQGRHAEAYQVYVEGWALIPPVSIGPVRVDYLVQMGFAAFNAGEPALGLRHANEAIAAGAKFPFLRAAHQLAGLALGDLGRLDEAEIHRKTALELARASARPEEAARDLAQLADLERRHGRFASAEDYCRQSEAIGPSHELAMTWAALLRAQGRFDEALERLDATIPYAAGLSLADQRRVDALLHLAMSWIESELERWDLAEAHLLEAQAAMEPLRRLRLQWLATRVRILAGQGRSDEAREELGRLEIMFGELPNDVSIRKRVLALTGRAALLLNDFARAERDWTDFLDPQADPVDVPAAYYHIGQARLGLGNRQGAREAFEAAVNSGIDSHHARLAREALQAMSQPTNLAR